MANRPAARHRAACRPTTPLSSAAAVVASPEVRHKAAALATSGLAIGVIAAQGVAEPAFADTQASAGAAAKPQVAVNQAVKAPAGEFHIAQASMTIVEKPAPVAQQVAVRASTAAVTQAPAQAQGQAAPVDLQALPASNGSIAAIAQQYLGVPYVYGGSTPAGFDCSGFVKYVYAQAGIAVNGRTDRSIMAGGTKVPLSAAQPGDILWHAGHVGIYLGNGQYIHAPRPGQSVKVAPVAYGGFTTAVRY